MEDVNRCLVELRVRVEHLYYQDADTLGCGDGDDINAACLAATWIADMLHGIREQKRDCPGTYWRITDDFDTTKRTRSYTEDDIKCASKIPKFSHNYRGPGARIICDSCGRSFLSDQKKKLLKKK